MKKLIFILVLLLLSGCAVTIDHKNIDLTLTVSSRNVESMLAENELYPVYLRFKDKINLKIQFSEAKTEKEYKKGRKKYEERSSN